MPDLFLGHPGRLYVVVAALPLLAFVVLFLIGLVRRSRGHNHPGTADRVGAGVVLAAFALSAVLAVLGLVWRIQDAPAHADRPHTLDHRWAESVDWVRIGAPANDPRPAVALEVGYRIDHLTAVLVAMVTVVGTLIVLFSTGYMAAELGDVHDHEAHVRRRGRYGRFFLYLALFAFSMLLILIADNLLLVFAGWELVGVSSYFLIGFYTERPAAGRAATKAFVMNRIGDAGFLVGLGVAWAVYGTFDIHALGLKTAAGGDWLTLLGLGVFAGCVGKSAQVPLHTWLPDAMEGPTPVSALIHAATMVAAGVYLVARCYPLFTPTVLLVVAWVGAITLFLSAIVATVQTDIKRVLAFSTGSQLGYMLFALGVGGWTAGVLHLLTHAFFKALLFLAAGSVIHAAHHEQNLLRMGGLRRKLPVTAYTLLVGVAAIVGVPLLSGWYSKDRILAHALGADAGLLLLLLPVLTVPLTGYYMTRLWLLAFAGTPRDADLYDHAHESPPSMTVPLVVLAVFSVGVGWGWPVWDADRSYAGDLLAAAEPHTAAVENAHRRAHDAHYVALALGLGGAALGVGVAVLRHRAGTLAKAADSTVRRALQARLYFDDLYRAAVTAPVAGLAARSAAIDKRPTDLPARYDPGTLDGLLTAVGTAVADAGTRLAPVQTGRVRAYLLVLGLTLAAGLTILVAATR
jgi:NADH-quinone oxidoreductase subunit L